MWMYFIWPFNGIEWCLLVETQNVVSKYLHKWNSFKIKIIDHSVCCVLPAPLPHSLASFLLQKQSKRTLSQCIHLERIAKKWKSDSIKRGQYQNFDQITATIVMTILVLDQTTRHDDDNNTITKRKILKVSPFGPCNTLVPLQNSTPLLITK